MTPAELLALADVLEGVGLCKGMSAPEYTAIKDAAAYLCQCAKQDPVATVAACTEFDADGNPVYARELDWYAEDIAHLPVGTVLYAVPVPQEDKP